MADNYRTGSAVIINWPKVYLQAIRSGAEVVSELVRMVYEREVGWMDEPPDDPAWHYRFDMAKGQRIITFIETFCCQSKGRQMGQPLQLELFQKAKLQLCFGWVDKDTGFRRFHEVVDIRGRKCGKSTETAAVALYCLVADGEGGAEVYCCANKKEQAGIIFDESKNMVSQSPELRALIKKRRTDLYFAMSLSKMSVQAADSTTMDGLNASFFVQDEFHEAKTSAIYDIMIQSQTFRDQPIAWLISTFGFVREGFFDAHYEQAESVALWLDGFHDYSMLPLLHRLDKREEWTDPNCWAKANPGLGKIKKREKLEASVQKAQRDPSYYPTCIAKDFNWPENSNQSWLPYSDAFNDAVAPMEYLMHSYAIGGCDLSATNDLTCATLLIQKPADTKIYVLQQYFIPEARLKDTEASRTNREAPYRLWAEQGWLTICPGNRVDYHAVTLWFVEMVQKYDIRPLWICYDAALSGYWVPEMVEYGFEMERIRQGPFTWTYPMKDMGGALADHLVVYQLNPILLWCLTNVAKKSTNKDGVESIQPVKCSKNRRIDGMVSLLNAWVGKNNHAEEYEQYLR